MKKTLLTALALGFVTTASASIFTDKSLPLRCHEAAMKLDKARAKMDDEVCQRNVWGYEFENAGKKIANNQNNSAISNLDEELHDLTYAKTLGCPNQPLIEWAISEAQSIKKAIS